MQSRQGESGERASSAVWRRFGLALSAGGGYLSGMMIGFLARKYSLLADPGRLPAMGALAGVVFFLCALAYQFLARKK